MTYPLARLVDAPDPSATVRYDFNDRDAAAPRSVQRDSFTLGAPSLQTAVDAVSPLYGDRALGFTHFVKGAKSDALSAIAVISRELLRPSNWMLVQLDAVTRPTWWRLRATGPEALSLARVYVETATGDPGSLPDTWELPISLTAENFGYGERITLGPYTVVQNSIGTHPLKVELPTIKGDAPAKLRVSVTPTTGAAWRDAEWLIGCSSGSADMVDPVVNIGDSDGFTPSSGGAVSTGDADFLGGDYRTMTLTTVQKSLSTTTLPVTTRGRYKMLLRGQFDDPSLGPTDDDTTIIFKVQNGDLFGQTTTLAIGFDAYEGWVDLGEVTFPSGVRLPDDLGNTISARTLYLFMSTAASTVTAKLDALKFIPIGGPTVDAATLLRPKGRRDGNLLIDTFGAGVTATYDGDDQLAWFSDGTGVLDITPTLSGGFPTADPAAERNLLTAIAISRGYFDPGGPYITTAGATADLTAWYHPRLLYFDGRP